MAKIYPAKKALIPGLALTPVEINEELQTIIGEFNGRLDRENIELGDITTDKISDLTFTNYEYVGKPWDPLAPYVTFEGQAVGTMVEVPSNGLQPSPDKMELTIDTLDGGLIVEASLSVTSRGPPYDTAPGPPPPPPYDVTFDLDVTHADFYNWPWSLVVTVDGRVVAESGLSAAYPFSSRHVKQYVPVAAGTHKVGMWIRLGASGRVTDPNRAQFLVPQLWIVVLPVHYEIMARNLFARHIRR